MSLNSPPLEETPVVGFFCWQFGVEGSELGVQRTEVRSRRSPRSLATRFYGVQRSEVGGWDDSDNSDVR